MSITDELREWMNDNYPAWRKLRTGVSDQLDRIDAAHEEALREAYTKGHNDGFDRGFASADDWCAQHEDAMAEHGWVRLPKDADGEYIHIGDRMKSGDGDVFIVSSVDYGLHSSHGRGKFWMLWNEDADFYERAYECRHHKQPTVEDLLREMLDKWGEMPSNMTNEAIVAEYAAKLRLAGDAE